MLSIIIEALAYFTTILSLLYILNQIFIFFTFQKKIQKNSENLNDVNRFKNFDEEKNSFLENIEKKKVKLNFGSPVKLSKSEVDHLLTKNKYGQSEITAKGFSIISQEMLHSHSLSSVDLSIWEYLERAIYFKNTYSAYLPKSDL